MSRIYRMVAITGPKEWNMWKEFLTQCDSIQTNTLSTNVLDVSIL